MINLASIVVNLAEFGIKAIPLFVWMNISFVGYCFTSSPQCKKINEIFEDERDQAALMLESGLAASIESACLLII